ncbi:MAG: hypothetical protein C5B43_00750, partial [Verrucomicrobia bacterium]
DHNHEKKYRKMIKEYNHYKRKVEEDLVAIGEDFKKKLEEMIKELETHDAQIQADDVKNDLSEKKFVRNDILRKIDYVASYIQMYIKAFCEKDEKCDINKYRKLAKSYRDYEKSIKKDIRAIEKDILAGSWEISKKDYKKFEGNPIQDFKTIDSVCEGLSLGETESFDRLFNLILKERLMKMRKSSDPMEINQYLVGSYMLLRSRYENEEKEIFMGIRELLKLNKDESSIDNQYLPHIELWNNQYLNLNGVTIVSEEKIILAFGRDDRKIIIDTDLVSMQNFIEDKKLESEINYYKNYFTLDVNEESIWGIEGAEKDKIIGIVFDFVSALGKSGGISDIFFEGKEVVGKAKEKGALVDGLIFKINRKGRKIGLHRYFSSYKYPIKDESRRYERVLVAI